MFRATPTAHRWRRARTLCLLLVAFAALQLCSQAQAQSSSRPQGEWFGWQNLAIDGAALAMFTTGLALEGAEVGSEDSRGWLFLISYSTFALGSPIVDWVHGNAGLGLGSLSLRLLTGVLLLVGLVSDILACEEVDGEDVPDEEKVPCSAGEGWLVAGAFGAIGAVILDSSLDRGKVSGRSASLPISLAVRRDGALLALRGAF